jgi:glutamate decarboxylase
LLDGIARADSVTIDGHKQLYMPMTCGMVYFKNPCAMDAVRYHANYVNRPGTPDLGIKSISGSREASSLILDSALKIMGSRGYALLIEHGIETAHAFAQEILKRPTFQLISPPQLNILTYRYCPPAWQKALQTGDAAQQNELNRQINAGNILIQRRQREAGNSFVSRTTLQAPHLASTDMVVLRCVIMNPFTTIEILKAILAEQTAIGRDVFTAE